VFVQYKNLRSSDTSTISLKMSEDSDNSDSQSDDFKSMRAAQLGFTPQKEILYNKLLPYQVDEESLAWFKSLKANLGTAIALRELRPGTVVWMARLNKYIRLYGIKFTLADHVQLVKLVCELLTTPGLEPWAVQQSAGTLSALLKKQDLITSDELVLPWRPLYQMYERLMYSQFESLGLMKLPSQMEQSLKTVIRYCRPYFPAGSTVEMMREWRPLMCPHDITMGKAVLYFELFLPTYTAYQDPEGTFKVWFDELIGFWSACGNTPCWEPCLINLLGRLAEHTSGLIDWTPISPVIFNRIQKMFDLPVHYQKTNVGNRGILLSSETSCRWVVNTLGGGSVTLTYLTRLFQSIESYYYSANIGRHSRKLTNFMAMLADTFIKRVKRERYKKPKWGYEPPKEHTLSDTDITEFIQILKPIVLHAMWSKNGFVEAGMALQSLATLRPEIVLPPVVERLMEALETVTQPHKLTASMYAVFCVARSLVTYNKFYPEGQTHVLPLLFATLPGIDTNDVRKSMVTLQFISTFAPFVPFVDCSRAENYHKDLTEEQKQICLDTAGFEDFVVEFLNRCFSIIENSVVEQTRSEVSRDDTNLSREDSMKDVGMASTFSAILSSCSEPIFDTALRKIKNFISGRILEWKVSGKIAASLVRCVAKARPVKGLAAFLPMVCRNIEGLIGDVKSDDNLDDELKFQLVLMTELVRVPGKFLLPHLREIESVLSSAMPLTSKEGLAMTGAVLRNTLRALSSIAPVEYKSVVDGYDQPIEDHLYINDWGLCGDVHNLQLDWFIPGPQETEAVQRIVEKHLGGLLSRLERFAEGEQGFSREEVKAMIQQVMEILQGAGGLMPLWHQKGLDIIESIVSLDHSEHTAYPGEKPEITVNGGNVRMAVNNILHRVQQRILADTPDDTKSLLVICWAYQSLLFYVGVQREEYDVRRKSFRVMKRSMENKLLGEKKHIRCLLVEKGFLQHEGRLLENSKRAFTEAHKQIYMNLLTLATSHYPDVRIKSQEVLGKGIRHFNYSYEIILPQLLTFIKKDGSGDISNDASHEQLKGSLYIILGHKGSMVTKHSWKTLECLIPAVIESTPSEKPSIIKILNSIVDSMHHHFDTFAIRTSVTPELVEKALSLWGQDSGLEPSLPKPSPEQLALSIEQQQTTDDANVARYFGILEKLCDQIESGQLHWRHYNMAVSAIAVLARHDIVFPARVVRIMVRNLNHDNIIVRKTSIHCVSGIAKQQKRKHAKIEMKPVEDPDAPVTPGDREDNAWVQYHPDNWPKTEQDWNSPKYIHKTHWGYYHWPEKMLVYAPANEQPKLDRGRDELSPQEKEMVDFFSDSGNISQLIEFLSLEENKGKDRFDSKRFCMWKGLFRNFGNIFLEQLKPSIETLTLAQQESSQRCAAEMIAGLIRGSKHWTWSMTESLWSWLVPLIRAAVDKVTVETIGDWGICFATASESRDPNRIHWMLEVLMEEPLKSQGSFLDSSRLYTLQGGLAQQEWRVGQLLHRLDTFLRPFLTHPYQNVRERLGSVLANIYALDLEFPQGPAGNKSPKVKDITASVLPQLQMMTTEADPELYKSNRGDGEELTMGAPEIEQLLKQLPPELRDVIKAKGPGALPGLLMQGKFAGVKMPSPGSMIPPPGSMIPPSEGAAKMLADVLSQGSIKMPPASIGIEPPQVAASSLNKTKDVQSPELPNGFSSEKDEAWEERQVGVRLLQTMCKLTAGVLLRNNYTVKAELYQFLGMLCTNESSELEPDLSRDCTVCLACLSSSLLPPRTLPTCLDAVEQVADLASWRARASVLDFLQVTVFNNLSSVLSLPEQAARVTAIVTKLLKDVRVEVREKAGVVLGGLLHCDFIPSDQVQTLMDGFKSDMRTKLRKKPRTEGADISSWQTKHTAAVLTRHSGVLGLGAAVSASPYDIPLTLPDILMLLADHLHDPQPIPSTIKKVFQDFKRTHQDQWQEHKTKFSDDQLGVLTDLLVSPSYYA